MYDLHNILILSKFIKKRNKCTIKIKIKKEKFQFILPREGVNFTYFTDIKTAFQQHEFFISTVLRCWWCFKNIADYIKGPYCYSYGSDIFDAELESVLILRRFSGSSSVYIAIPFCISLHVYTRRSICHILNSRDHQRMTAFKAAYKSLFLAFDRQ